MFQQRIVCHRLPPATDSDLRAMTDRKGIQEAKRRQLHAQLIQFEAQLMDSEQRYCQELSRLEMDVWNRSFSSKKNAFDRIMQCVQACFNHWKSQSLRSIRFREACLRAALIKLQRRQASRKTHKKNNKVMIDVYPQVIVDAKQVCLDQQQLAYLSHHGK